MSSKELGADDRSRFPAVDFQPTKIGADAVGIVVRREVVDGALSLSIATSCGGCSRVA